MNKQKRKMKFETLGESLIISEESIEEYTSNEWSKNRKMKFKTAGALPIISEESIQEYTSN